MSAQWDIAVAQNKLAEIRGARAAWASVLSDIKSGMPLDGIRSTAERMVRGLTDLLPRARKTTEEYKDGRITTAVMCEECGGTFYPQSNEETCPKCG
jgi:rubrerythrin